MSALEPTTSNTTPMVAQEPPFIKFPPFPKPPEGVTIIPFKDFKARGIQLFSEGKRGAGDDGGDEEEVELDALGIPTVELRVKHATDEAKSSTRKKRKKKKAAASEAAPVKKLQWYEEWEEGEDLRVTKGRYDLSIPPVDRFFQSAYDFRTGRPWPPVVLGLNNLWDQFRLFTGLLVNPSVYRKVGAGKYNRDPSPDSDSDDEENDDGADGRPTKRQRSDGGNDQVESGAPPDPHKFDEEVREELISSFLSDPEKAIRIFLSSYMRERGLIWSPINLTNTPRIVSFFLAFVLRNRVLPEPTYQRGLKRALETLEHAKKELPLTYKVGNAMPDAINQACRDLFGRQGGMIFAFEDTPNAATTEEKEKPQASINVTDTATGNRFNVELPSEADMQLKDAIEDNVDMNTTFNPISSADDNKMDEDNTGWDNAWGNGGGWGGDNAESSEWGNNAWAYDPVPGDEEAKEGKGASGDDNWNDTNWNRPTRSLFELLGPTVLPLTHTTGIVECSTRRVVAVQFPPGHPKGTPLPAGKGNAGRVSNGGEWRPSPRLVEDELDACFAKVILEPWGREEGDIYRPDIWRTSRGPVIDPNKPSSCATTETPETGRQPHNPLTDTITLLVDPSLAEMLELVPGLGLAAMWIEITRQEGYEVESDKEGNGDRKVSGRFWYHEDVSGIFPSFYTAREEEEEE